MLEKSHPQKLDNFEKAFYFFKGLYFIFKRFIFRVSYILKVKSSLVTSCSWQSSICIEQPLVWKPDMSDIQNPPNQNHWSFCFSSCKWKCSSWATVIRMSSFGSIWRRKEFEESNEKRREENEQTSQQSRRCKILTLAEYHSKTEHNGDLKTVLNSGHVWILNVLKFGFQKLGYSNGQSMCYLLDWPFEYRTST